MVDYPIPLNRKITLQSSVATFTELLDFPAYSAAVSNSNNQWLHFVGTDQYAGPGAAGQIVTLPGVLFAELEWAAPPGAVQGPAAPGTAAKIVFYSVWMAPYPGLGAAFQSIPKPYDGQASSPLSGQGAQATCTLAGVQGRRWVCASLAASFSQLAGAADNQELRLLDGPSASPNILWQMLLSVSAVAGSDDHVFLTGLAYFGSAGSPMTFEFVTGNGGIVQRTTFGAYLA